MCEHFMNKFLGNYEKRFRKNRKMSNNIVQFSKKCAKIETEEM